MEQKRPKQELIDRIIALQRELLRVFREGSTSIWLELDITMAQLRILFYLSAVGSSTPGEIATALSIARSAVTPLLDRLSRRKMLVRKLDSGDRRSFKVRLTEKGATLTERLRNEQWSKMQEVLESMKLSDLTLLEEGFIRAHKAAEESQFRSEAHEAQTISPDLDGPAGSVSVEGKATLARNAGLVSG